MGRDRRVSSLDTVTDLEIIGGCLVEHGWLVSS